MYDLDEDNDNLTLTGLAIARWREVINVAHFTEELKHYFEELVRKCARSEWGAHTYCAFSRDKNLAIVEHFDGRKKVFQ